MTPLRFRQIHLDFHTSEKIIPIAEKFDAEAFARTLKEAHVDSVTCFSRCHHGLIYHDTQFEARHPGLSRNLLAEQIGACHRHGIKAPIYISVGFDEFQAKRHPEWLERNEQGVTGNNQPLAAMWKKLCLGSSYLDYVSAQTREVCERFDVDGVFFDIIFQGQCLCEHCLAGMETDGLEPETPGDRVEYAARVLSRLRRRLSEEVRALHPDATVFFNSGHVGPYIRPELETYSHLELESLPSGGWGYDHFPLTIRYARTLGADCLGMTGKFLKSWADFGGFKNPAALQYECFTALAEGAKCSIGDQLHPRGVLEAATYELVGPVYASVEAKEPWCAGARAVAEIGVFTPEAIGAADGQVDTSVRGALRMLLETHHQFDVIDADTDWTRYAVVILPDKITFDARLGTKAEEYLAGGGSLIASGRSALKQDGGGFACAGMPVTYCGEARYAPNYAAPRPVLANGLAATPYVMYDGGFEVEPVADAEVLADVWWPYFNRTWDHFCSHQQTPPAGCSPFPAVVRKGAFVYFSHPIFAMYARDGGRAWRQMVVNALAMLLPEPAIVTDAPTSARVSLLRQEAEARDVLHVLHYIPEPRSMNVQTIEDVIPLHDVHVGVRRNRPQKVYLAPSGVALDFEESTGRVWVTLPRVDGHAMVVFED